MISETSSENEFEEQSVILHYDFNKVFNFKENILDLSGNGLNLMRASSHGVSSPKWGEEYGICGPGFKFYGNRFQSQCLYRDNIGMALAQTTGSICLWIQPFGAGNKKQAIFSISNGCVPLKTEFLLELDYESDFFKASLIKDGIVSWSISAPSGSLATSVDLWTHLSIVQDGLAPKLFINGYEVNTKLKVLNLSSDWFSYLFDAVSPPTKICVGAAPRVHSPFMALGLFAILDEIKVWNEALTQRDIQEHYAIKA